MKQLHKERVATVRANGLRNIVIGICCMCSPLVALGVFRSIGVFSMRLFAIPVMVGLYGGYTLINGILKVVSPKIQQGDASD